MVGDPDPFLESQVDFRAAFSSQDFTDHRSQGISFIGMKHHGFRSGGEPDHRSCWRCRDGDGQCGEDDRIETISSGRVTHPSERIES